MSSKRHRNFVLVPGAWHGAFVYRDLVARLRALGHTASALTLTGLGDRRHVGNDSADLETHVEDVVSHIEMEDLQDITLVGWSYGGMVITGVLARLPGRISAIVSLDAFVPSDGRALVDYVAPNAAAAWDRCKERNLPVPPLPFSFFGLTDPALVAFIEPRLAGQPWRTLYQPVKALKTRPDIPFSYVVCTGYGPSPFTARLAEMEGDPTMQVIKIDTSHFCMMTALENTVAALVDQK